MNNSVFRTTEWDEKLFLSSQHEWQKLLENSDADPFFMSWQWMSQWWINWGSRSSDKLYIIAIYLKDELVGIAPLYIYEATYLKGCIPIKRLQFLGSRFSGSSGTRSEYLGTIVKQGLETEVNSLISQTILKIRDWDEIVLSDLVKGDYFYQTIIDDADNDNSLKIRKLESDASYLVNTKGSFTKYLGTLGKNTRLKLFNRRKALAEFGSITLEYVDLRKGDEIFQCINEFHLVRYGKPAFSELNIAILRQVIDSLPESVNLKCSSLLKVDKRPVSAMVNIFLEGKIYNIQLGFLERFDKRISLGTLHLGYTLEMAFEFEEITYLDLLAGHGKSSDYKSHLAQQHSTLESFQILRNPIIRLIYFVNDKLKGIYKKSVNSHW
jgi:hypothetical protein